MSIALKAFRARLNKGDQVEIIDLTHESFGVDPATGVEYVDVKPLRRAWLCTWANRHSRHSRWLYFHGDVYRLCQRCAASVPPRGATEYQLPPVEVARLRVSLPPTGVIEPAILNKAERNSMRELVSS